MEFSNQVTLPRHVNAINLVVQLEVQVNLVCRYGSTVSVTSNPYEQIEKDPPLTILVVEIVTNIDVQPELLDQATFKSKSLSEDLAAQIIKFWIKYTSQHVPFDVKVELVSPMEDEDELAETRLRSGGPAGQDASEPGDASPDVLRAKLVFSFLADKVIDLEASKRLLLEV